MFKSKAFIAGITAVTILGIWFGKPAAVQGDPILQIRVLGSVDGVNYYDHLDGVYQDQVIHYRVEATLLLNSSNQYNGVTIKTTGSTLNTGDGINAVFFNLSQTNDTTLAPIQVAFDSVGSLTNGGTATTNWTAGTGATAGTLSSGDINDIRASLAVGNYTGVVSNLPEWVTVYSGDMRVSSVTGSNTTLWFDGAGFTASTNSAATGVSNVANVRVNGSNFSLGEGEGFYHDIGATFGQRLAMVSRDNSVDLFGVPIRVSTPKGATSLNYLGDSEYYGGITSTATHEVGTGGQASLGTTAKLLGRKNSLLANTTGNDSYVQMAWRTRTTAETFLTSDVLRLSGMVNDPATNVHLTDTFVLQMNWNPSLTVDPSWYSDANDVKLFLGYKQGSGDAAADWVNAVLGNTGGTATFVGNRAFNEATDLSLGKFGIDTASKTAWAVLNHNSDFAIVFPAGAPTANPAIQLSEAEPLNLLVNAHGSTGMTITNVGEAGSTLNYTLTADGGGLTVVGGPFSGALSQNQFASHNVTVSKNDYGTYTLSWTASASGLSNVVKSATIVVGKATAMKAPKEVDDFGGELIAPGVTDLAGLASKVDNSDLPGLNGLLGSEAKLLYGTVTGNPTVRMSWRERLANELEIVTASDKFGLASDVLRLSGIPEGTIYVLQMSYNPNVDVIGGDVNEDLLAGTGQIYMATWDGTKWVDATGGFSKMLSGSFESQNLGVLDAGDVGTWGVNLNTHEVWAVLDHNSDFAIVPEPATMAFLALGGLAMAGAGLSRRRTRKAAK
jgi:hypothetical protein